jgi:hypothetical protein
MSPSPPDECANCGAGIPRGSRACPQCGADEHSGWREVSTYDGLDLPDEAWTERGMQADGALPPRRINGLAWHWWLVAVALLVLLTFGALGLF